VGLGSAVSCELVVAGSVGVGLLGSEVGVAVGFTGSKDGVFVVITVAMVDSGSDATSLNLVGEGSGTSSVWTGPVSPPRHPVSKNSIMGRNQIKTPNFISTPLLSK
jgi:hypothetical protein